MAFCHLHLHTEFSLLDGACRLNRLIPYVKSLGQTALAITDHGVMFGVIDFYRACKNEGIKPIIGCEVYVAPKNRFEKTKSDSKNYYHMILLCENNEGYHNLIKLVSLGFTEGFYNKPRVDDELLKKYSKGLICLSACLAGELPQRILNNDYAGAKEKALYYQEVFGKENFYLELQNHNIPEQKAVNSSLVRISEEINAPLVATNDCHYITPDDYKMHGVLLCIQTNHTIYDEDKMEFSTNEFYVKSEEQMAEMFPNLPQALENSQKIAERCNVEFEFGVRKLPHFELPKTAKTTDHFEYMKSLCEDGLQRLYSEITPKITSRLEYELRIIEQMGFVDYFLIVADFVNYAKSCGIPVGPGRGSGAGSLCAYCMGITGIDPMKYDLLFERFLNPERVSMPDFDIDFCRDRRQEVIDYVVRKYGVSHVAQIIAFGTMAAKGAVRDVGRALGVSYGSVDSLAKQIPFDLNMTLEKALKVSPELKKRYDTDEQSRNIIDMAKAIEGMPRHATTHAAGVVITENPVSDYVPLAKNDEAVVTQFTMTTLEELGLLKMDFLGLRNLTVINDTVKITHGTDPTFSIENINENDEKVLKMISAGHTEGVFQFESAGMKSVLMQLKPERFEDLIAVISLYRPGPMDSIPKYLENRHNQQNVKYTHPKLEKILKTTYGCIVYQEQVMEIFRELGGYTLGRADIVRRAMSKKKHSVMEKEREIFINGLTDENGTVVVEGCARRGVDETAAKRIFDEMESFASYAFNKSHAAAYALVSYQTAWLKCYYPKEYMAALLTSMLENQGKLAGYIAECGRMNIEILPPHVNESVIGFTVSNYSIRYGLIAIKNLGNNFLQNIINERKSGKFKTYYDFCKRIYAYSLNSRALESLIKCGALDDLGYNRREMLTSITIIFDDLEHNKRNSLAGQMSIFESAAGDTAPIEPKLPKMPDLEESERLHFENEVAGMYLSGHPLNKYEKYNKHIKAVKISEIVQDDLRKFKDGTRVTLLGVVRKVKTQITKSNATMAFVELEDKTGTIEVIVFPNVMETAGQSLVKGNIIEIAGAVNHKEEEDAKIICNELKSAPQAEELGRYINNAQELRANIKITQDRVNRSTNSNKKLYLKIERRDSEEFDKVINILEIFQGGTPVVIYITNSKTQLNLTENKWVEVNDTLLTELKRILGDDCVVLK
ncbi:MAG: DNA polymerase III subunit alpha [Oscillospiraceae bacterium]|jgi:DNA polymerase-3 subunit alpha|nr:DNA polymerase III subunit alpha [Oscillospiraceae bacterium]